jgi:PAS domain-containing protein
VESLFGYSAADIDHAITWWEDRVHPDDRERLLTSLYEGIEGTAATWRGEYRFRNADGTYAEVCEHG